MPYLLIRVMLRFGRIWPTRPAACQVVPQVSLPCSSSSTSLLAERGEVVGGRAAGDAAADDDDAGMAWAGSWAIIVAVSEPSYPSRGGRFRWAARPATSMIDLLDRNLTQGDTMSYVDGFVIPVPAGNKEAYLAVGPQDDDDAASGSARLAWSSAGAATCPTARSPTSSAAVAAQGGETVALRLGRMALQGSARQGQQGDDGRPGNEGHGMPFDGKRMIYGGFEVINRHGERVSAGGSPPALARRRCARQPHASRSAITPAMIAPVPTARCSAEALLQHQHADQRREQHRGLAQRRDRGDRRARHRPERDP